MLLDTLVRPINGLLVRLLRSPAHKLASGGLSVIEYEGRQSGKTFQTPVGYQRRDNVYWVLISTPTTKSWWKNFREPWPARLVVRQKTIETTGLLVGPGSADFIDHIEGTFARLPWLSRQFDIDDYDRKAGLTTDQRSVLSRSAAVVRFDAVTP